MYRALSFKELINQFITQMTNYNIYISIIIVSIILMVLMIKYKSKQIKILISVISITIISMILYYYNTNLFNNIFKHALYNMYFFHVNSIIFLITSTIMIIKNKYYKVSSIFYTLVLINILFSLFMTHYLDNIDIVVLGNVNFQIVINNIIYIIYYVYLIFRFIKVKYGK